MGPKGRYIAERILAARTYVHSLRNAAVEFHP